MILLNWFNWHRTDRQPSYFHSIKLYRPYVFSMIVWTHTNKTIFFWLSLSSISSCSMSRCGEEGEEEEDRRVMERRWGQWSVGGEDTDKGGLWATETPAGIIVSSQGVTMGLTVLPTPPKPPSNNLQFTANTSNPHHTFSFYLLRAQEHHTLSVVDKPAWLYVFAENGLISSKQAGNPSI